MKMNDILKLATTLFVLIGMTASFFTIFAKAEDLKVTQKWVQQEIAISKIQFIKREIFELERKYTDQKGVMKPCSLWHEADQKRYFELKLDLEREYEKINKK